jgi:acid-sensing ion channel, other
LIKIETIFGKPRNLLKPLPWKASSTSFFFDLHFDRNGEEGIFDFEAESGIRFFVHRSDELPSENSLQGRQNNHQLIISVFLQQTLLSNEVKRMSIERRNCYFEHEKSLELFKAYSKTNCDHECQSFAFAFHCGCVPFYLLKQPKEEFCTIKDKKCLDIVRLNLTEEVVNCNCLDKCETLTFSMNINNYPT